MRSALPRTGRATRRPNHPFQIRQKPWVIQPFFIAPVLPGETLKNLLLQSRVVSDPIVNPLIGWWKEYYFFYVKHRDLENVLFETMMLDVTTDMSSVAPSSTDANLYQDHTSVSGSGPGIKWASLLRDVVVKTYFRAPSETASTAAGLLGTLPLASINNDNWMDSLILDSDFIDASDNVPVVDGSDANTTLDAKEVDAAMRQWQLMRDYNLTDMTYEDFLRSYGVKPAESVENHQPELVRYIRNWSYPANTVNPATGVPASAMSWAIAERADKDRFFKEPGFLFGVTVTRPKVYLSKQTASLTQLMDNAFKWLPAVLRDDPYTSVIKREALSVPLENSTGAYWLDLKDLFIYGEQFVNFALTATDAGMVALPTAALNKRYVSTTDIDALFVDSAGGKNLIREDGIVSLAVLGALKDTSPQSMSRLFV